MPSFLRLRRDARRHPRPSLLGCSAIVMVGHSGSLMADDVVPSFIDERSPAATREQQEHQRTLELNVQQPATALSVSENTQVNVRHINIRGGPVFELDELAAPLEPLVGETATVGQTSQAVKRITARYQKPATRFPMLTCRRTTSPTAMYNLASAAFGLEFTDSRYYRLGVEYARPIAEEDLDTDNRDGRINARVSWQFDGG
ncbi:POTRA domain-containing protein, ShlB-type [Chromohalobacter canadensis]|uniref:POTRA domain-containing protein, ShlB-type n=1 Tax=Chromohalobacter canadensis TaxID=141389 RepID=A0A285VQ83_9GAMM|nr:POTRA domain-containing protein [Chromohalobacter canadensis]SOC56212.1 POTRA domain-containing protein, ShlB-type [Chromohalobacter canadensis]